MRAKVKEKKQRIITLAIEHGLTASVIAQRLGCRANTISKWLRTWGYEWNQPSARWEEPEG